MKVVTKMGVYELGMRKTENCLLFSMSNHFIFTSHLGCLNTKIRNSLSQYAESALNGIVKYIYETWGLEGI